MFDLIFGPNDDRSDIDTDDEEIKNMPTKKRRTSKKNSNHDELLKYLKEKITPVRECGHFCIYWSQSLKLATCKLWRLKAP